MNERKFIEVMSDDARWRAYNYNQRVKRTRITMQTGLQLFAAQ